MLGNRIGPIEWTLVIRQVARQPLPRVTPEKTCIEVSHCYRQDQDTHLYLLEHSMDGVDGEVSPPILLVLNLTQLKSRGIRLWKRLSRMKPVLSMTRQELLRQTSDKNFKQR